MRLSSASLRSFEPLPVDLDCGMRGEHNGRSVNVCPACGGTCFEAVGEKASGFRCSGSPSLEHPAYSIRECLGCGLYYKSSTFTADNLSIYYKIMDSTPYTGDYSFPTDDVLLAKIRCLPPKSRVLDFGCNTGRIMNALGSGFERFGYEPNEPAAEQARLRGISMLVENELNDRNHKLFDAIVLSDVYEHLVEPVITLRKLADQLMQGGRLFLVTGLADAVRPRELISEHWYFRIGGHLHMLSLRHLDWLGAMLGLSVNSVEIVSHYKRDPLRFSKQLIQAALYRTMKLKPTTTMAASIRRTYLLRRASQWTNLPATDQMKDHVVAELRKM
jgi:SAM-dependent methyltransferase